MPGTAGSFFHGNLANGGGRSPIASAGSDLRDRLKKSAVRPEGRPRRVRTGLLEPRPEGTGCLPLPGNGTIATGRRAEQASVRDLARSPTI